MKDYQEMMQFIYSCKELNSTELMRSLLVLRKWREDAQADLECCKRSGKESLVTLGERDIKTLDAQIRIIHLILNNRLSSL